MKEIALHILDIAENAIDAGSTRISFEVTEDTGRDLLIVQIQDNGRGMDRETLDKALDPFYTEKPGRRFGLGLPLFAQAAREAGGTITVESIPGEGTAVKATFKLSHPDRKPLGDVPGTIELLRASHPTMEFTLEHRRPHLQGGKE